MVVGILRPPRLFDARDPRRDYATGSVNRRDVYSSETLNMKT